MIHIRQLFRITSPCGFTANNAAVASKCIIMRLRCSVVLSGEGSRPELGTQVSYFTRGGRIIERRTTTRRFPGGGIQTETTERDVGPDTGTCAFCTSVLYKLQLMCASVPTCVCGVFDILDLNTALTPLCLPVLQPNSSWAGW